MGIFSGLFKSWDKPENRTPGNSHAFYLGGSSSDNRDANGQLYYQCQRSSDEA